MKESEKYIIIAVLDNPGWEEDPTYDSHFAWVVVPKEDFEDVESGDDSVLSELCGFAEYPYWAEDNEFVIAVLSDKSTWAESAFYLKVPQEKYDELVNCGKTDLRGLTKYGEYPEEDD
jgi:hypothetical protein